MSRLTIKNQYPNYFFAYIIFTLLMVALYKFFFLFDVSENFLIEGTYGDSLSSVFIISIFLIVVVIIENRRIKKPIFSIPIALLVVSVFIVVILTASGNDMISKLMWYSNLLVLYFAIVIFCKNTANLEYFILLLQVCTIIACVLLIVQAFIVNSGGQYFLHIHFIESGSWYTYRNGRLRILENQRLYMLAYIISIVYLQHCKIKIKKLLSLLTVISVLVYDAYVGQTRMIIIIEVLIAIFSIIINSKLTKKRLVIYIVIMFAIAVFFNMTESIFQSVSVSSSENSVVIRLIEYGFFMKLGIYNMPFGYGFNKLVGEYYAADVGIVGLFSKFGIISLAAVIYIFYLMFKLRKIGFAKESFPQRKIINNILLDLLLLSPLLSVLEGGQMHVFILEIALTECLSRYKIRGLES